MKSSKRMICQAVVLAVSAMAASAAMAQVIQGGGSTLIQPSLNSEVALFGTAEGTISYFGGGSGQGQAAFLNNDPTAFTGQTVTGTISYGNSDSALTSSQVSTAASYALTSTNGKLIQLPYAVTPITIPVVNPPAGVSSPVVLNDADLCGIFSGRITDWAGTGTAHANPVINPVTGVAYTTTSKPIHVVYRSDGSGTSDLLTRHLQAVCSSANSSVTFTEGQTFTSSFVSSGVTVPSTFGGESGSGSVATRLTTLRTAGTSAFGYLSPDYTNATLAPSSAPAIANNLAVASLKNKSGATVAPTYQNATAALAGVTVPSGAAEANPFNWVPGAITPTPANPTPAVWEAIANPGGATAYPIAGTTNIILSQCYRMGGRATLIHDFLNKHYNDATFIAVLHNNGFDVPSAYVGTINTDILAASSLKLDIQDTSVCTTGFGR
jgi:phosphate transport system substrate-binding protein